MNPERFPSGPSSLRSAALRCACLLAAAALPAHAAEPAAGGVQEQLVTPAPIFEFEFDQASSRFCWISVETGELWVADVDPVTGAFSPVTGKGQLVDVHGVIPGNGAEWVAGPGENRLVYNVRLPGQQVQLASAIVAEGAWQATALPNGLRKANPSGSFELVGGHSPILSFRLLNSEASHDIVWRFLDATSQDSVVPMSFGANGGRWVPGKLQIVFSAPIDGGRQAFLFDAESNSTHQLTFDGSLKQTVWMWRAPDFDDEYVLFASVKGETQSQIRVYRLIEGEDGAPVWTVVKHLNPPKAGVYFWSAEPFVHNGKSYIFWVASEVPDQPDPAFPSQIWLAAAHPDDPLFVNLSEPTVSRFRLDPEIYVTSQGPHLYYNRYFHGTPQQYEGVFRVSTGLGPPE